MPDDRGRFVVTFGAVAAIILGASIIIFRVRKPRAEPVVSLAGALRCSTCSTNWPRVCDVKGRALFAPCAECACKGLESRLDTITNAVAIDLDEAWSRKRHAMFEAFYANEWPARRADREAALLVAELDAFAVDAKERAA